jgi:hypothetical protein
MSRRLPLVVGTALVALFTAACGSATDAGLQAVRDSGSQMFFEIPSDWSVYQSTDLAGVGQTPFVSHDSNLDLPVFSRVVFQGAGLDAGIPAPNTSSLEYPVGSAVVRTIPAALRDQMSRYWLAELVVPYHSHPVAQEQVKQDFTLGADSMGCRCWWSTTTSTPPSMLPSWSASPILKWSSCTRLPSDAPSPVSTPMSMRSSAVDRGW